MSAVNKTDELFLVITYPQLESVCSVLIGFSIDSFILISLFNSITLNTMLGCFEFGKFIVEKSGQISQLKIYFFKFSIALSNP